jgi:hypothetical protein
LVDKPESPALIITTELVSEEVSEYFEEDGFACVNIFMRELKTGVDNNEFIFVVDCSGSMGGKRIEQARFCLDLFIRSLPEDCYFNIVRFGSRYEKLFEESVAYNEANVSAALSLASSLSSNFGGTEIRQPLQNIYDSHVKGRGIRQIFILTDGEVSDTDSVLSDASSHCDHNRIFSIGIGTGADAGLVEGIANATGGQSGFVVGSDDDLSEQVINQLSRSLCPSVTNVSVHVSGSESFEISPFPLLPISPGVSSVFFVKGSGFVGGLGDMMVSGTFRGSSVDEVVRYGGDSDFGTSLGALFAYESLRCLDRQIRQGSRGSGDISSLKSRSIELSISSGVLCDYTAFVGVSEKIYREKPEPVERMMRCCCSRPMACCCCRAAAPCRNCCCCDCCSDSDDDMPCDCCCSYAALAPRKRARAPSPPKDEEFSLKAVTSRQTFQGYWSDVDSLIKFIGAPIEVFPEVSGLGCEVFATILAIALLRKRLMNSHGSWSMIEAKAVRYLGQHSIDIEGLISRAVSLIP